MTINGIVFHIEGQDAPTKCCIGHQADIAGMEGVLQQARSWIDVVRGRAIDHAGVLAIPALSVVLATLFALKQTRRPADHRLETVRRSKATCENADLEGSLTEEAARIAFLKRYGGPSSLPLESWKDST